MADGEAGNLQFGQECNVEDAHPWVVKGLHDPVEVTAATRLLSSVLTKPTKGLNKETQRCRKSLQTFRGADYSAAIESCRYTRKTACSDTSRLQTLTCAS